MKKFSFRTLILGFIVTFGLATFFVKTNVSATTDYLAFTPIGCNGSMTVYPVPSSFAGGNLGSHMIYVVSGNYTITSNIVMDDCSTIVVDSDSTGSTLTFQNGAYITSTTQDNILIRGHDDKKLTLINGDTSPGAIILQNIIGATISYTSISGFSTNGGIRLFNSSENYITYNTLTNNKHGIRISGSSTGNKIMYNNIFENTDKGIWIGTDSDENDVIDNDIINNGLYGIDINGAKFCNISGNTINNHLGGAGLFLSLLDSEKNKIEYNTISSNTIGIRIDGSKNNNFSSNIISSNTSRGVRLRNNATGNIFNNDMFSGNISNNISISEAHNNQFLNITAKYSSVGVSLTNANYNIFSGSNILNNTNGVILDNSLYNIFNLTNNNNGISLIGGSDNNSIYNKQSGNTGLNNITIYNGSNNVITGGIFSTTSTTSTTVTANLKFDVISPRNYTIAGAGMSGTYTGTVPNGNTTGVIVTFTAGNGSKVIEVTYENGNIQYDSITKSNSQNNNGNTSNGGNPTPTCTSQQLVCSGNVRVRGTGVSCQGGNIGNACTITTGNINSGTNLPVGSIAGSTFSNEMNQAYLRAYANGITTMPTIQQANMTGKLIRSHMAKMISAFAILLGDRLPNESLTCNFNDIANQSIEMKFYIKLSCQLGLMGQNISNFNPREEVTRAQFGTIMSRLIRGSLHNGGTPYYTSHLNALKLAGIMTQISNPQMKEIRGYVMIMMKRTYEGGFLNN